MAAYLLKDSTVYPDDSVLEHHLGPAKRAYDALAATVSERFPDAEIVWKF